MKESDKTSKTNGKADASNGKKESAELHEECDLSLDDWQALDAAWGDDRPVKKENNKPSGK